MEHDIRSRLLKQAGTEDQEIADILASHGETLDYQDCVVAPSFGVIKRQLPKMPFEDAASIAGHTTCKETLAWMAAKDKRKTVLLEVAKNPNLPQESADSLFERWINHPDDEYITTLLRGRGEGWAESKLIDLDTSGLKQARLEVVVKALAACQTERSFKRACELFDEAELLYWTDAIFVRACKPAAEIPTSLFLERLQSECSGWSRYGRSSNWHHMQAWDELARRVWESPELLNAAWGTNQQPLYERLLARWSKDPQGPVSFEEMARIFAKEDRNYAFLGALKDREIIEEEEVKFLENYQEQNLFLSLNGRFTERAAVHILTSDWDLNTMKSAWRSITSFEALKEVADLVKPEVISAISPETIAELEQAGVRADSISRLLLRSAELGGEGFTRHQLDLLFAGQYPPPHGLAEKLDVEQIENLIVRLEKGELVGNWSLVLCSLPGCETMEDAQKVRLFASADRATLSELFRDESGAGLPRGGLLKAFKGNPNAKMAAETLEAVLKSMRYRQNPLWWLEESVECLPLDWSEMSDPKAKVVYGEFKSSFGADAKLWETGLVLLQNWSGTLRELTEAAKSI